MTTMFRLSASLVMVGWTYLEPMLCGDFTAFTYWGRSTADAKLVLPATNTAATVTAEAERTTPRGGRVPCSRRALRSHARRARAMPTVTRTGSTPITSTEIHTTDPPPPSVCTDIRFMRICPTEIWPQ